MMGKSMVTCTCHQMHDAQGMAICACMRRQQGPHTRHAMWADHTAPSSAAKDLQLTPFSQCATTSFSHLLCESTCRRHT